MYLLSQSFCGSRLGTCFNGVLCPYLSRLELRFKSSLCSHEMLDWKKIHFQTPSGVWPNSFLVTAEFTARCFFKALSREYISKVETSTCCNHGSWEWLITFDILLVKKKLQVPPTWKGQGEDCTEHGYWEAKNMRTILDQMYLIPWAFVYSSA